MIYTRSYSCFGVSDNIAIQEIINDFFSDYSNHFVRLKLNITGVFGANWSQEEPFRLHVSLGPNHFKKLIDISPDRFSAYRSFKPVVELNFSGCDLSNVTIPEGVDEGNESPCAFCTLINAECTTDTGMILIVNGLNVTSGLVSVRAVGNIELGVGSSSITYTGNTITNFMGETMVSRQVNSLTRFKYPIIAHCEYLELNDVEFTVDLPQGTGNERFKNLVSLPIPPSRAIGYKGVPRGKFLMENSTVSSTGNVPYNKDGTMSGPIRDFIGLERPDKDDYIKPFDCEIIGNVFGENTDIHTSRIKHQIIWRNVVRERLVATKVSSNQYTITVDGDTSHMFENGAVWRVNFRAGNAAGLTTITVNDHAPLPIITQNPVLNTTVWPNRIDYFRRDELLAGEISRGTAEMLFRKIPIMETDPTNPAGPQVIVDYEEVLQIPVTWNGMNPEPTANYLEITNSIKFENNTGLDVIVDEFDEESEGGGV